MTAVERILQKFCVDFLTDLSSHKVMNLEIPKTTDAIDVFESVASTGHDDGNTEKLDSNKRRTAVKTRNLFSTETSRGYAQIYAVATLVVKLLVSNETVSLRDVYYALPKLFKNQAECNACILEFGQMMRLKRYEMNIIPAARGFMSGPIMFRFNDSCSEPSDQRISSSSSSSSTSDSRSHQWIDCESADMDYKVPITSKWTSAPHLEIRIKPPQHQQRTSPSPSPSPVPVPPSSSSFPSTNSGGDRADKQQHIYTADTAPSVICDPFPPPPPLRYILVVEKEGVFHRLLEDDIPRRLGCILVTGCGYPDIATRSAVYRLSQAIRVHTTGTGASTPMSTSSASSVGYSTSCNGTATSSSSSSSSFVASTNTPLIVVGLADYNPHGLALLLTYRFPSKATVYEGADMCSDLKWCGMRSTSLKWLRLKKTPCCNDDCRGDDDGAIITIAEDENESEDNSGYYDSDSGVDEERELPSDEYDDDSDDGIVATGKVAGGRSDYREEAGSEREEEEEEDEELCKASTSRTVGGAAARRQARHGPLYMAGVKSLSTNDRNKIRCMLNTDAIKMLPSYEHELELMLRGNIKFDIEAFYERGFNFLAEYLQYTFTRHDFI